MRIYCSCYWTFPNDSSKHRKRIETGRQLWLTFKKISIYRRSWVLSFTSSSFFKSEYCQGNYFISLHCSLSFWKELTDPGPEGASGRWLGTCHFLPSWVPSEVVTRLFVSVFPSSVFGPYAFSPTHQNRREGKEDWQWRGSKNFTSLWPILIFHSPCLYLIIAHAWVLNTQVLVWLPIP